MPDLAPKAHHYALLRFQLEKCAKQFRFYEEQHRAKGTPDADAKAEVNRVLAAECENILFGTET